MKKLFRWESWSTLAAGAGAGISYWAGINYLPSIFIIAAGILIMGMFAEIEDALLIKLNLSGIGSNDVRLIALHVVRTVVLLAVGVLVFVALGSQF
ncbi:MAG: hypothetical protein ACR2Q3_10545 [Woeseiaceae bacterium]